MNFLAHLHLSYPHTDEMVGNFIGDYVKGKNYRQYPNEVAKGIVLHRKIDFYTDTHELQRECKMLFREEYGLYAGIVMDMLFDHILAKNWGRYSEYDLLDFTHTCYDELAKQNEILPERVQNFLPRMRAINRLYSYASTDGITFAIKQMSKYTSLPDRTDQAMRIFGKHEAFLERQFDLFYNDLKAYVEDIRPELNKLISD